MVDDNREACRRAREALSDICGPGNHDSGIQTFYLEAIVEQGRRVSESDVNEVASVMEQVSTDMEVSLELDSGEEVRVQTLSSDRRPVIEEVESRLKPGIGTDGATIHSIFRLPVNKVTTTTVDRFGLEIRQAFEKSDASVGRGFRGVQMVDEEIVRRISSEIVRPPMEDIERL